MGKGRRKKKKKKGRGEYRTSKTGRRRDFSTQSYDGATVSDDVIMAGIDKLAIYSMADDDATLNRLRRRVLLLVLKIYNWNLLDRRRRDMMRLPVKYESE